MFVLFLVSSAYADLVPDPPPGARHTVHELQIDGLVDHPDVVLVAFDGEPGKTIGSHRVFSATNNRLTLANGASSRDDGLSAPAIYSMSTGAYESWDAVTSKTIAEQYTACDERGEGCAHISRFEPSYASPTEVVSCGVDLTLVTSAPVGSADTVVDIFQLAEVSASSCVLEAVSRAGDSARCSQLGTGVASVLLGLGLLVGARRSRVVVG